MKLLVINFKENYNGKLEILQKACEFSQVQLVSCLDPELVKQPELLLEWLKTNNFQAVIHRNEHGRLFADSSLPWIRFLLANKFPVLSVDFGYLGHYQTFMFDYYDEHLRSSIHQDWEQLSRINWDNAPDYVKQYRNEVFQKVSRADNSLYAGKVAIWMQWNAKLLRPELGHKTQAEWVNDVVGRLKAVGKQAVLKHNNVVHSELYEQTVPLIDPEVPIVCDRKKLLKKSPRLIHDRFANYNLVAGCDYHVILCSSVSNLMTLCNKPVIAMGGSWFNALDVFHESADPTEALTKPTINRLARDKWLNWWLQRQAPMESSAQRLFEIAEKALAYWSRPTGELWKYEYIYANPELYPNYGSSNHGKKALPMVQELNPESIIDIGCGGNEFKQSVMSLLPKCRVIGADPASPKADVRAPAHKLPIVDKDFNLLTAFDVLEHIPEHELQQVFTEFQRVSTFFLFRIAQKDSRKKVFGQTLHPTIHPVDWWLEQLKPFVIGFKQLNGYILGQWKELP